MQVLMTGNLSSGTVVFWKLNGEVSNNTDTSSKAAAAQGTEAALCTEDTIQEMIVLTVGSSRRLKERYT